MSAVRLHTGVLVFPDVEVLDFCGPFEVFSVTRLNADRRREEPSPFDVFLVAESVNPVMTTGGMQVTPKHDFDTCPRLDLLVVPGGWGTRPLLNNPRVIDWITRQAAGALLTTSVCTGALLLGRAGLLAGKPATTHRAALALMRQLFPDVTVDADRQVVASGKVRTSAGIAAGIDMALLVVAELFGEAVARQTATYMEYPYPVGDARRVPVEELP